MLEVCVQNDKELAAAQSAGAERIELCSNLELDGLTPSMETVQQCLQIAQVPVVVLLRNRAGNFLFNADEQQEMLSQAREIVRLGVAGIVAGGLTSDFRIDAKFVSQLRGVCGSCELVFHRAFDQIADKSAAIEALVTLGVDRVLTSGGVGDAIFHLQSLRNLNSLCHGRIELLPAGGIRSENAKQILLETGCTQLHASFRLKNQDRVEGPDPEEIRLTRSLLDSFLKAYPKRGPKGQTPFGLGSK